MFCIFRSIVHSGHLLEFIMYLCRTTYVSSIETLGANFNRLGIGCVNNVSNVRKHTRGSLI